MRINMGIFKALSHQAKVIMAIIGSGITVLATSPEMLTMLLTQPWTIALPVILPKIVSAGAVGGSLFNMQKTETTKQYDGPKE
jgi:hypothetical protein